MGAFPCPDGDDGHLRKWGSVIDVTHPDEDWVLVSPCTRCGAAAYWEVYVTTDLSGADDPPIRIEPYKGPG